MSQPNIAPADALTPTTTMGSSTTTPKTAVPGTQPTAGPSAAGPSKAAIRQSFPRRLLSAYLRQLGTRPLRTKMITSSFLFFLGDSIAQFGIEGRQLPFTSAPVVEDPAAAPATVDSVPAKPAEDTVWDPLRALRLVSYGGLLFAPLAHNWLNTLQRVELGSRFKTLAARVALDQMLWGPFVVCLFWSTNGILEGKTPSEVVDKVKLAFLPVYMRSVMVFGPTATISFAFVPLQHRLLVGQTVGLGWNTYLSYVNHINNKRLAAAAAAHSSAEALEAAEAAAHVDTSAAHAEVERTQAAIEAAKARHEKILASQGGGASGVGVRMGH